MLRRYIVVNEDWIDVVFGDVFGEREDISRMTDMILDLRNKLSQPSQQPG
jgi:hypothetical protein